MSTDMPAGEEKLWKSLADSDPGEVCRRTEAAFDPASGLYLLRSFGRDLRISPEEGRIFSDDPESEPLLRKFGVFLRFSVVGYLAMVKDISPSGRLVNPLNMKCGQLFFRGSHVLPLDKVAQKYCRDREGFRQKGMELGGTIVEHGDAAVSLFPFPRVPVALILWLEDEEFPARADLLFDSVIEHQLPIDVIWSIAMMSVIAVF